MGEVQHLFLAVSNGSGYRIVRRGDHFVVEFRRRENSRWEAHYKAEVVERIPNDAVNALTACLRKVLMFIEHFARHDFAESVLQTQGEFPLMGPAPLEEVALRGRKVSPLPRNETLNLRVPKELKARLIFEASRLSDGKPRKLTVADLAIYRLEHGGDPD